VLYRIPPSTIKEAMRGVTLLTLLAFLAHAHAEEVAANDLDKFVDEVVNELFDKADMEGEEGDILSHFLSTSSMEGEEGHEGEEVEESDETEKAEDEGDETEEDNESEELEAHDMDRLVDKLVDRARTASFLHNADLDTATLAKPKNAASNDELPDDETLAAAAEAAAARGLSAKKNKDGHEGHEGDEGNEGYEGHEGDEEEETCEQDRQGQACQVPRLSWEQVEDPKWVDKDRLGEEQAWKDCEQETNGSRQA
jgi:hypothetical protein